MFRKFFFLSAILVSIGGGSWVRAETKAAAPATTPAAAPAATPTLASKEEIKKAIASGDHKALAQYYKDMAAKERADAAMHEEMIQSYKEGYVHYKGMDMSVHCALLKDGALKKAKKYDEMASAEEKLIQAPAQK